MTNSQMIQRMQQLLPTIETKIPMSAKQQALEIMIKLNEKYAGIELNLRSLIKASRIAAMGFNNPEEMIAEQIIAAE